jgi:hypothetical protein
MPCVVRCGHRVEAGHPVEPCLDSRKRGEVAAGSGRRCEGGDLRELSPKRGESQLFWKREDRFEVVGGAVGFSAGEMGKRGGDLYLAPRPVEQFLPVAVGGIGVGRGG